MKSKHFLHIPDSINLDHKSILQTVSKACLKSIKQQYSFLLDDCTISLKLLRTNRSSVVEKFFVNHACAQLIMLQFSEKDVSLLLIILVNSFPKELQAM